MAWTPPSNAVEVAPVSTGWKPPSDAVEASKEKPEEPGWFMPGSKSEALVRGFSQGATLGFGDEIQALIRTIGDDRTYAQLRDEERASNASAQQKNPGSYLGGNIVGAAPSLAAAAGTGGVIRSVAGIPTAATKLGRLGQVAAGGAEVGAVNGLGTSNADTAGGAAVDTAIGAGIGGATAPIALGAGQVTRSALQTIAGTGAKGAVTQASAQRAADQAIAQARVRVADSVVKDAADAVANGAGSKAAVIQAQNAAREAAKAASKSTNFGEKVVDSAKVLSKVPFVGPAASLVTKVSEPVARGALKAIQATGAANVGGAGQTAAQATTLALTEMSKSQAKKTVAAGQQEVQKAVQNGQPSYAAEFTQLQNPSYRAASTKVDEDDDTDTNEDD